MSEILTCQERSDYENVTKGQISKRKKLNNRSPYETFSFYHGEDVLEKLGCKPVAAGDIMLKPALLKK